MLLLLHAGDPYALVRVLASSRLANEQWCDFATRQKDAITKLTDEWERCVGAWTFAASALAQPRLPVGACNVKHHFMLLVLLLLLVLVLLQPWKVAPRCHQCDQEQGAQAADTARQEHQQLQG